MYADHVLLPDHDQTVAARIDLDGRTIACVTVQDRPTFLASPEAADTLDLGARLLTPAFANAHTHLSMVALRGLGGDDARRGNVVEDLWFRLEGLQSAEDIRAFARIGALECVLSGQGAAFDHYYHARSVGLAMADVGLEGVVAETLQDLGGPAQSLWSEGLDRTEALATDTFLAEHGVFGAAGPHATDTVSDVLWARITALARRLDLPLHLHLAQSAEELGRARAAGFDSPVRRLLAHGRLDGIERVWLAHGLFVTSSDRAALSPQRDVLVHCPLAQTQFAFPADVPAWRDAGIAVALGTDAGACNDGMDVQREVILLAHGASYGTTFGTDLGARLGADPDQGGAFVEAVRVRRLDQRAPWAEPRRALDAVWDVPARLHPRLPVGLGGHCTRNQR